MNAAQAIDVEEYVSSFRPDLMEVVAAWASGARFADVLKMSDIFEVRSERTCCCKASLWVGIKCCDRLL